jgi:hypothetical protein
MGAARTVQAAYQSSIKGKGQWVSGVDWQRSLVTSLLTFSSLERIATSVLARHCALNAVKKLILDGDPEFKEVAKRCALYDEQDGFPKAGTIDEHRMMIDTSGPNIRFRIRLYDSTTYTAYLAKSRRLGRRVQARRVAVKFTTTGIEEVASW